jgi:DNA-binding response OmpR family regulator
MLGVTPATPAARLPQILVVDPDAVSANYGALFEESYGVNVTPNVPVALEYIRRAKPGLVVTELFPDGGGIEICRAAKAIAPPATVLVTTAQTDGVPDALTVGCDGILLKPFAPNLLMARVSRLLRERSNQLRLQAARSLGKSAHLSERSDLLKAGTNRVWPNTQCPYCDHSGVTSFDFASMRRAWYACLDCKKVWVAKRQE